MAEDIKPLPDRVAAIQEHPKGGSHKAQFGKNL
jgi:hypothetical protein